MKKIAALLLLSMATMTRAAFAMDGEFDRTVEVDKYVAAASTGTRGDLVPISKDIYVSGLFDPRLSAALAERLSRDYKTLKAGNRADTQYGAWLVKALASTGSEQAVATLQEVKRTTQIASIRSECADELELIEWHRGKNKLMASRANHNEGADPRNSHLLNLLKSEDFSYKQMAADRISWEKRLDVRLLDEMAAQLLRYMNDTGMSASRAQTKAMGLYAKLLGYSGDPKYQSTLEQVMASKAGTLLKKHAKEALKRLK